MLPTFRWIQHEQRNQSHPTALHSNSPSHLLPTHEGTLRDGKSHPQKPPHHHTANGKRQNPEPEPFTSNSFPYSASPVGVGIRDALTRRIDKSHSLYNI